MPWVLRRVAVDQWVVMPNHLHGVIVVHGRGGSRTAPTKPLGRFIGAFKTVSTKRLNEIRGRGDRPLWQRNYYEHIVRNENELNKIREYITTNPQRRASDRENPAAETYLEDPWL